MTGVLKAYAREAYLIPIRTLSGDDIENAHARCLIRIYDDKKCSVCENYDDRHSDVCDSCAAFLNARQMSKLVEEGGKTFLSIPLGASKILRNWATTIGRELKVVEHFPDADDFSRTIRFTGKLYGYQEEAVQAILERKRGMLKSPPRSGKTVIATAAICRIGKKALVIASQIEWLNQFRDTFLGSESTDAMTNARESQVRICKTYEDFVQADVCLATFSMFFSKRGKELLARVKDLFSFVTMDECHYSPALETSRVVARLNSEYRIGMSGTIERKITEEIRITQMLFGRVIYESQVDRMVPRVHVMYPAGKVKEPSKNSGKAGLVFFQSRLERDTARKESILRTAIKYARKGHLVLIPLSRVESILEWTRWVNSETERPGFALPFYGGLKKDKRAEVLQMARDYRCRILVGNIALLSVGTNIPRASCLVESGMNSNIPKAEQRFSRILTPFKDKPEPIIVFCLDDLDIIRGCKRKEIYQCLIPRFKPNIDPQTKRELDAYLAAGKRKTGVIDLSEGL
jgi:superfamily II DNA or RNA helicase